MEFENTEKQLDSIGASKFEKEEELKKLEEIEKTLPIAIKELARTSESLQKEIENFKNLSNNLAQKEKNIEQNIMEINMKLNNSK